MKKYMSLLLAVVLIAAMSLPVFAEETIDSDLGSANVDVKGVVQYMGSSETQIISVDVAWENMTFTYVEGVHYGWDPETHEYAGAYEGYWEDDRSDITVTNHSNVEVTATFTFESMVETVSGAFTDTSDIHDDGVLMLASAVDKAVEEAPAATATFGVSGSISESADTIGVITVLIESVNYDPEIRMFGFVATNYLEYSVDRSGRITYTVTIPRNMPDALAVKPPVIVAGDNMGYATDETCQIALLNSDGTLFNACVVNIGNLTYDLEKGCWTTKSWALPKTAGTYKLAYSNDGGETWTQIDHVLKIVISVD